MIKRKIRYHVVDAETGEILSRHQRLNGRNSARVWIKAYRKNTGFKAVIQMVNFAGH